MAGLLGSGQVNAGLLGGLLGQMTPRPAAPAAPRPPQRERVSGWRVFDRVLGGQTVSEGLDAERARLEAEAMRPQAMARMAQLRSVAESMGPAAMIAFETNPEAFGAQLAEQYAPQVIAAGGIQSIAGTGQRVAAPSFDTFGDSIVRKDPLSGAVETVAQRGPTFSEQTGRINATNPVPVSPGVQLIDPATGQVRGRGLPRILAASDGTDLVSETGAPVYSNPKDAPPVDPARAQQIADRAQQAAAARSEMADNLSTGLTGARQFVDSAGVWTHLMPWQRQDRANLEGHLETIKGNISFERLMEMKANSPNGASGLGALSDREARMLANTVGALDADMSPQELQRSFEVIDRLVAKMRQEGAAAPAAPRAASGPIAQDGQGNRVQWNGTAWVPIR